LSPDPGAFQYKKNSLKHKLSFENMPKPVEIDLSDTPEPDDEKD
jgi:hypothetical protein